MNWEWFLIALIIGFILNVMEIRKAKKEITRLKKEEREEKITDY